MGLLRLRLDPVGKPGSAVQVTDGVEMSSLSNSLQWFLQRFECEKWLLFTAFGRNIMHLHIFILFRINRQQTMF